MQLNQPRNNMILAALAGRGNSKPALLRHDALPAADAYLGCGCHPEVVERVWDQLGSVLPSDCRYLVYGIPALVDPAGLILAVGIGTQYGLRIMGSAMEEVKSAGAKTITTWSHGGGMDIQESYGHDWIFGSWLKLEEAWCKAVYVSADNSIVPQAPAVAKKSAQDFAAIAEEERRQHRAKLEQRVAMGESQAEFELFQVLMNASMKQRSPALLQRAEGLLQKAAAAGIPQAVAMTQAWPILKREAEKHFPKSSEA